MDIVFEVGDYVILVKRGDADGCSGGPNVGTTGVIKSYRVNSACGPYLVTLDNYGGWWTDASHLKLDDDPNAPCDRGSR